MTEEIKIALLMSIGPTIAGLAALAAELRNGIVARRLAKKNQETTDAIHAIVNGNTAQLQAEIRMLRELLTREQK